MRLPTKAEYDAQTAALKAATAEILAATKKRRENPPVTLDGYSDEFKRMALRSHGEHSLVTRDDLEMEILYEVEI